MEVAVLIVKYGFIAALAVEGVLILRSLVRLAREKARPEPSPAAEE
jgi:hypothetical protein